jgi:hypothetical protein
MGRKIRAAKASLVAAFLATGGAAATAKAGSTSHSVKSAGASSASASRDTLQWGHSLVRFLKLDGFPAYLKVDGFADYYKLLSLDELTSFYSKDTVQVDAVLALYQKAGTANGSLLESMLNGLEQYWKYDKAAPLEAFFKQDGALDAYNKFTDFYFALEQDAVDAFAFFQKETGITGIPEIGD